jgi:predicted DNA-binding transcriptional regulator YafY
MREKDKLEIVLEAIRTYRGLNITYRDLLGQVSSRAILPFRVYEHYGQRYLQAYCWLAKDALTFALPGILRAELRHKVVDKAVYVEIRNAHEMLDHSLSLGFSYIASVNLEEV